MTTITSRLFFENIDHNRKNQTYENHGCYRDKDPGLFIVNSDVAGQSTKPADQPWRILQNQADSNQHYSQKDYQTSHALPEWRKWILDVWILIKHCLFTHNCSLGSRFTYPVNRDETFDHCIYISKPSGFTFNTKDLESNSFGKGLKSDDPIKVCF